MISYNFEREVTMTDNKYFGIETVDGGKVYVENKGCPTIVYGFEIDEETKKACAKVHEDISTIRSPEDKAYILAKAFPNRSKDMEDLAEKTEKLNEANKKYDKVDNEHKTCKSAISNIEHLKEATERLIKEFPELAPSIRKYAEASVKAAATGKKNKEPKPATKLPAWKKVLKPVAKLFNGKANFIDNVTGQIDYYAEHLANSSAVAGKDEFKHDDMKMIEFRLKAQEKYLNYDLDCARYEAANAYREFAPLKVKEDVYKAAEKEIETKAPEVIKKNKARALLQQRGLMPETKGSKDVSGVVKVDQNIASKMEQKYAGR